MYRKALVRFWDHHPALFYGIGLLLGVAFAVERSWWLLFPMLSLAWAGWGWRVPLGVMLALAGGFYVKTSYVMPEVPRKGMVGKAHIDISAIKPTQTHFGSFGHIPGH